MWLNKQFPANQICRRSVAFACRGAGLRSVCRSLKKEKVGFSYRFPRGGCDSLWVHLRTRFFQEAMAAERVRESVLMRLPYLDSSATGRVSLTVTDVVGWLALFSDVNPATTKPQTTWTIQVFHEASHRSHPVPFLVDLYDEEEAHQLSRSLFSAGFLAALVSNQLGLLSANTGRHRPYQQLSALHGLDAACCRNVKEQLDVGQIFCGHAVNSYHIIIKKKLSMQKLLLLLVIILPDSR